MFASSGNLESLIRKLRKKLRQIENLETLHRPLTEEEIVKVNSKDDVRAMLQGALEEQLGEEGDEEEEEVADELPKQNKQPHSEIYGEAADDGGAKGDGTSVIKQLSHDEDKDQESNKKTHDSTSTVKENQAPQQGKGDVKKQKPKSKNVKPSLCESYCRLSCLEGHSDLVTALVVVGDRIVTASRDTTLKCWDIKRFKEIRSYGGHTAAVTSLLVLNAAKGVTLPETDQLLVSGSLDSTFKLWTLNSGQLLKSVYTYNPVVRIAYCVPAARLITGSDGGKLELWDLATGGNMFSSRAHNASITGLKVSENTVYSCDLDGIIKIHHLTDGDQLTCVFVSENLKTPGGDPVITRSIRCLDVCSDLIFFGDDARNIRLLDWKKGLVKKLANHTDNFTFTDALCCHGDLLLSSSYDLDDAVGYINVRSSKTLEYLATFDHADTERIVCLDYGYLSDDQLFIVSGGMELLLWEVLPTCPEKSPDQDDAEEDIFKLTFIPDLAGQCVDSEAESSDVDSDDSEIQDWARQSELSSLLDGSKGWTSWCSVL